VGGGGGVGVVGGGGISKTVQKRPGKVRNHKGATKPQKTKKGNYEMKKIVLMITNR